MVLLLLLPIPFSLDDEFWLKPPMDGFFGFLFLVCIPSFFIVNGLLTWNHPWDNVYFQTLVSHLGFLVNIDTNRTQQPSGARIYSIIWRGHTVCVCVCVCVTCVWRVCVRASVYDGGLRKRFRSLRIFTHRVTRYIREPK